MEVRILGMDWYDMFACMGGPCPLTCCAANWKILLTDEELEIYKNMDHPFRDCILEEIDMENKAMKNRDRYCAMRNDEGWCKIILECGEEYLSATCKHFPRYTAAHGDIMERTVGIGCPVAAGYLFREEPIEFDFGTCEIEDVEMTDVELTADFELYDGLSYIRTNLIELFQNYSRERPAGVAFLMTACMIQIKEAFLSGKYSKAWAVQFADESFSQEVLQNVFAREETLVSTYERKAEIISFVWKELENWLRKKLEKFSEDMPFLDWDFLWKMLGDTDAFADAIARFSGYFGTNYRMVLFCICIVQKFYRDKTGEFFKTDDRPSV